MAKTLRFHQNDFTDYSVAITDRSSVKIILRDRTDHDDFNAVSVAEFYQMGVPDAVADFERFVAKGLALSYDELRAENEALRHRVAVLDKVADEMVKEVNKCHRELGILPPRDAEPKAA